MGSRVWARSEFGPFTAQCNWARRSGRLGRAAAGLLPLLENDVSRQCREQQGQALHLMFLFAFQDVTWIEVPPQGPGPVALPQTSTPVPGGIQGFPSHNE